MDSMTIKEAATKWGVSTRAVTYHVVAGRIRVQCGADFSGSFAKIFKEKVGMTPSQYRFKMWQNKHHPERPKHSSGFGCFFIFIATSFKKKARV